RNDRGNPPKPIPERIREAREASGYQLETFAELLNITKQGVARYESGLASPGGEVMGKIIAITKHPPSFFTTPPTLAASGLRPCWRCLKRMEHHHRNRIARRMEWAHDVVVYLEQFIHLPPVDLPVIDFDAALDDTAHIERAAEIMRDHWGLERGPVRDLS